MCVGFYCGFGLKRCVVWLVVCCGLILSCCAVVNGDNMKVERMSGGWTGLWCVVGFIVGLALRNVWCG